MGKLFRDKYLAESARYKDYDYSLAGKYYVTICTKDKTHFFGEIENGEMILSEVGKITQQMLKMITMHFPFVGLDEFVIMPDHIHIIIVINETQKNQKSIDLNYNSVKSSSHDNVPLTGIVEPLHATALRPPSKNIIDCDKNASTNILNGDKNTCTNNHGETKNMYMSSISPKSGSLATIIRSFKSAVTIRARGINPSFTWQPRFYDHIIRTGIELSKIRSYIKSNPAKWNYR